MWFGIGDTLTTLGGLWYTDAVEIGPVAGPLMSAHGTGGLVLVKVIFIAIAAGVWYRFTRPTSVAIPTGIDHRRDGGHRLERLRDPPLLRWMTLAGCNYDSDQWDLAMEYLVSVGSTHGRPYDG